LEEETGKMLGEVQVVGSKKDHAEEIVRYVIRHKESILQNAGTYSCNIYIKATDENPIISKSKKKSKDTLTKQQKELEGLIGFFVNSLVLRSDLSGNPTFRQLLERVRNMALEAYEHQDLPFEKLVEEIDPDRDLSRNPLFQVAFALQNAPMQSLELPGLTLEPATLEFGSTRFDLEVHLWEPSHGLHSLWQSQEGLSGFISYSTDLFDRDRIGRLIGHFQTLLAGIVANPNERLSDLPLLTTAEQQQRSDHGVLYAASAALRHREDLRA